MVCEKRNRSLMFSVDKKIPTLGVHRASGTLGKPHFQPWFGIFLSPLNTNDGFYLLYPATQKVAGYYVLPSELWVSVHRPSICPSVCASFPCSNFSTFWPIFFKLCIDIGIGEEWYGIATGRISFWNNRVMALDVCQKCFALRFCALTLIPFYRFSSNFA